MPDKSPDILTIIMFCLAILSGAVGGCGAASMLGLRRQQLLLAQFAAYAVLGMVVGGLSYSFGHHIGHPGDTLSVLGWALAVGIGVPLVLAAHNFGVRWIFRLFGVEVEWTFRPAGKRDEGRK